MLVSGWAHAWTTLADPTGHLGGDRPLLFQQVDGYNAPRGTTPNGRSSCTSIRQGTAARHVLNDDGYAR